MSNRLGLYRAGIILGLLLLIGGAILFAANATREAPQHKLDAQGGHDHDGDGKSDH